MAEIETVEEHAAFGGVQGVYKVHSEALGGPTTFAVFVPPGEGPFPLVTYLSGLTCTHANVMEKGEYRRLAAELGLVIVCPDTSPRGEGVPNDDAYDLGQGAGFYINATQAPWAGRFNMFDFVTKELTPIVASKFPVDVSRQGIFGHSMGGHGAITVALNSPGVYKSVSAFSPIVAPSQVPWGQKAFTNYFGDDQAKWRQHDSVALLEDGKGDIKDLLVDVGTADPFLEKELKPELLEAAAAKAGVALTLRRQPGYDHSYYFISSFMDDHLRWHADRLK